MDGLLVQQNRTIKGINTELSTAIGWKVNGKLLGANLTLSTTGKHSVCTTPCLYDCVMSFTWICCLLLELCSMIPKTAWSQGWLFKYVLWQNENWEIDSFTTTVKKKRDWQKIKQRCHRYCVFNVCCKLQMATFQFPDGNGTLAFAAVSSLTLWTGYLLEVKLIQTTVLPHPDVFV